MRTPEENEIRDRAYAMWVDEGSPEGREQEFWYRAERELTEEGDIDRSATSAEVSRPTPPAGLPTH